MRYLKIARVLDEELAAGRLELLAGDCPILDATDVAAEDQHFTICHQLQCVICGETYHIGLCIRGDPLYEYGVPIPGKETLRRKFWGGMGTLLEGTGK